MDHNNNVLLQGICYDEKSSFQKGASKAPELIKSRLWSDAYNTYTEDGTEVSPSFIMDKGDFNIDEYWDIYTLSKVHLSENKRLVSLGGDHSITYPIVKAISEIWTDIHILHIDAHSDLYNEFEGDPHSHACPFARIMEDQLVNRLSQVGIRALTPHQREQAKRFDVDVIEMKDFNLSKLPKFESPVYISLDIDAFDPGFAPGVSHQESGGLSPREVLHLIHSIEVPIIGADIVEFNPENDYSGITAALSAKMTKEIIGKMLN